MVDQKPPRLDGDERTTLLTLLQFQRESLVRKTDGIDDAVARQSPVASGTSLLWLVRHLAQAEVLWVVVRFAGRDIELPDATVNAGDTLDEAIASYHAAWDQVDEVVDAAESLDEVASNAGEPPVNLRWVLSHLLEETARHAGHADILRELSDGQTGR